MQAFVYCYKLAIALTLTVSPHIEPLALQGVFVCPCKLQFIRYPIMIALIALNVVLDLAVSACQQLVEHTFPAHTFVMRKAPKSSACFGDDNVYSEIRCPGNLSAMSVLRLMEIPYTVIETWQHPERKWKLLRFVAHNPADLLKLHEACGNPTIPSRDLETQEWLQAIAFPTPVAAAKSPTRDELVTLAKIAKIPGRSRMTKDQLIEALRNASVPIAA